MDNLEYERKYLEQGCKNIAGIDEAGRGPLAGPVVSAAVIMPLGENQIIEGIDDSKKLSAKKRDILYDKIMNIALAVTYTAIDEKIIDDINILEATKLSMRRNVEKLSIVPDVVLIDAVKLDLPMKSEGIIKGDQKSYSIACASIIAKVTRDRMMIEYAKVYPNYGFERHKGYGTKIHIEALKEFGACEIHRNTFIKKFVKK